MPGLFSIFNGGGFAFNIGGGGFNFGNNNNNNGGGGRRNWF